MTEARNALVGYSGFVGSNLDRQAQFDAHYNSSNIGELRGRDLKLLVFFTKARS